MNYIIEVLEKMPQGRKNYMELENLPCLTLTKSYIRFSDLAEEKLKIRKGDEILFAKHGKKIFLSIVTNSDKRGYLLNRNGRDKRLVVQSPSYFKRLNCEEGLYILSGFPIYNEITKLDWFELTFKTK